MQRRLWQERLSPVDSGNMLGNLRYGRCLEEAAEGDLDVRRVAYAGQELGGQDRITAQLEEVVVDTYTFETEDGSPEPCQHLLKRRAWRGVGHVERRLIQSGHHKAELLSQTAALQ